MIKSEFRVLQAVRAIAATIVVVFHINHSFFGIPRYWVNRPFGRFFEFGHAGVEMFFVLSGFIIFAAHASDIGKVSRFKSFVWKRFRRIYPIYWVVLAVMIPVFFVVPNFGDGSQRLPGVIADSILLVHAFGDFAIVSSVSWTLFHEVAFYTVFSLLLINVRVGVIALGFWMAASVVEIFFGSALPSGLEFYFSSIHLLFGMGMLAAWAFRRGALPWPRTLLCVGGLLFMAVAMEESYGPYDEGDAMTLLYGISSAMILAGALQLERMGRIKVPQFIVFVGNASYSIYLVHVLALSVIAKAALTLSTRVAIPHSLIFIAMAAAGVCSGLAVHVLVEVPLLASLGRRGNAIRPPAAPERAAPAS